MEGRPFGSENTVAVHIRHLREKIEIDPAEPRYLKVVWGQGYSWKGDADMKDIEQIGTQIENEIARW